MLAAIQAPVIMMSQNRQAERDRIDAAHDYEVNLKAEIEIMALHEKLDELRHSPDRGHVRRHRPYFQPGSASRRDACPPPQERQNAQMSETVHRLIEQYGLLAVFLGCLAEGETAAILGGFFAHQHVFALWQTFVAVFTGAFLGDTAFFVLGRHFAQTRLVRRFRRKPGFSRAYRLVTDHPNIYVLSNRYIYGMRVLGGIVAGLSGIATSALCRVERDLGRRLGQLCLAVWVMSSAPAPNRSSAAPCSITSGCWSHSPSAS